MNINFDEFNSLPQQVAENKKNIEELMFDVEQILTYDFDQMEENIADLQTEMSLKQNKLIAGTNITLTTVDDMVRIDAIDTDTNVDVKIDGVSIVVNRIADIMSMNGDYNALTNPFATKNDIDTLGMVKQDKLSSANAGNNITINTPVGSDNPTINVDGNVIKPINNLVYIEDLTDGIYQGKAKYFCYDKTNNQVIGSYSPIDEINIILQVTTQDSNTKMYVSFMNIGGARCISVGITSLLTHTGNESTYSINEFLSLNNIVNDLDSVLPYTVLGGTVGTTIKNLINAKQDTLISGTNIKTLNGNSLLGSGDISIGGIPRISGDLRMANLGTLTSGVYLASEDTKIYFDQYNFTTTSVETLCVLNVGKNYSGEIRNELYTMDANGYCMVISYSVTYDFGQITFQNSPCQEVNNLRYDVNQKNVRLYRHAQTIRVTDNSNNLMYELAIPTFISSMSWSNTSWYDLALCIGNYDSINSNDKFSCQIIDFQTGSTGILVIEFDATLSLTDVKLKMGGNTYSLIATLGYTCTLYDSVTQSLVNS